jgi:hypothetical protein
MRIIYAVVAAAVVGVISLATFPKKISGQSGDSSQRNLDTQVKTFSNYSKDLRALEDSLHGEDLQAVEFLDATATRAEDRLDAAKTMLDMYDNISCKPDRDKVRLVLKEHLAMYSWLMDHEADRTAGFLQFAKVPAAAQLGLRMKDDMRAAKGKLDEIGTSLK